MAPSDDQAPLCPLCNERPLGIDGICPSCWLTLAKLEDGHHNVVDVSDRNVFIEL